MNFSYKAVAFFGRRLSEYVEMFNLEMDSLKDKDVLDCAAGPASFTAEANLQGVKTIACDPLYSLDEEQLVLRAKEGLDSTLKRISAATHLCTATSAHMENLQELRESGNKLFFADFKLWNTSRYVEAALPTLPFSDASFDLVLVGNFLLVYTSQSDGGCMEESPFDADFHLLCFLELLRVSRGPVLIYPAHTILRPRRVCPLLPGVLARLNEKVPIHFEYVASIYSRHLEQPGELNLMLRIERLNS
eukprot:TRINITY_DN3348_c0_g1_i1.p1 TRINITY_DN3348_c0_g1~~TRINITY_DN3348_c0_g1_i1.p1  ORF type:complete len:247 (+),score=18.30 TRINITY_DN3348_c0_g1_i1:136-876(+)